MEDRRAVGGDAHAQHHVAQLRDRRVGQHLLDVRLHQGDRRGHQRRQRADPGGDFRGAVGARCQSGVGARDHVDAGGDHRRGMDQRARRAWGRPWRRAARQRAGSARSCRWRPAAASGR